MQVWRAGFFAMALFAALMLSACKTAPIQNVDQAAVPSTAQEKSLEDIAKAIQRAGISLGWRMDPKNSGHIVATLDERDYMAKVDINYSRQGYSIAYKDSRNLDHSGNKIHKHYNRWIQNLDQTIQEELLAL